MWQRSLDTPEEFWSLQAKQLDWIKEWDHVLEWENNHARWFVGGLLNVSYNCVDRHAKTSRKNKVAIIWEGEDGDRMGLIYHSLYREVNKIASALKELGVKKDTAVAMYMPMVPELPIAMLACTRIGAPFTQVYSGFSSGALAERIQHIDAKIVITSDGLWRRGKIVDLKGTVDKALEDCPKVEKVVVLKRTDHSIHMKEGRDLWYNEALALAKEKHVIPEPLASDQTLYVLYT